MNIPKYQRHKARGLARVKIDGKDVYLGEYGSPESREKYRRAVAEWLAGQKALATQANDITVVEVVRDYRRHAEAYYRGRDCKPTGEVRNLGDALRPVRLLYGSELASEFGPRKLAVLRESMVASGLSRGVINARIHRIRRCFRWAASVELVSASVVAQLDTLAPLEKYRTTARETEPIQPVSLGVVEATLPHMPRPVAAMVRLQLLSGCRPGEIMQLRGIDLAMAGSVWTYRPLDHKGSWREGDRVVHFGPRAQAVLREFLTVDSSAYLFSPQDAVRAVHAARERKGNRTPSAQRRRVERIAEGHAERYDRRTYRQAIVRACHRAFPHPTSPRDKRKRTAAQQAEWEAWRREHSWCPLQLRHTTATAIRARYGLEAAQVVLGHANADVTQVYAERDLEKAAAIMLEIG